MDFETLYNDYIHEDLTTISDEVIEIFSKIFSDDIYENYDIGEIIIDFVGHHEAANLYEKIEKFCTVVKEHHPNVYKEDGDYIAESLIIYYCFTGNEEKLKEHLSEFLSREYDYQFLTGIVTNLCFFGYSDLVNMVAVKEFQKIKQDERYLPGAEYHLAELKFDYELEAGFKENLTKEEKDWSHFLKEVKPYGLKPDIEQFNVNYLFIDLNSQQTLEHVKGLFKLASEKESTDVFNKLKTIFIRRMYEHNCSFMISRKLWNIVYQHLKKRKLKRKNKSFYFQKVFLNKKLSEHAHFTGRGNIEPILLLWGSEYIIEFLNDYGYYSSKSEYLKQLKIIIELKEEVKSKNKNYLWSYSFIHKWKPSKVENVDAWKLEEEEFKKSYDIKVPEKHLEKKIFGGSSEGGNDYNKTLPIPKKEKIVSVRTERKIGRNEKVSVRYKDGTVKSDVKYKKVINDLENGDCELI